MTTNTIVEMLKEKASSDPVTSAVLHVWALRKRARQEVTLDGLHAKMKAEGFSHNKRDYEPLLRLMARMGLGRLQTDSKGNVVALKEVKTKLQSLGQAVCNGPSAAGPALQTFRRKNRYQNLAPLQRTDTDVGVAPPAKKPAPVPPAPPVAAPRPPISITVNVGERAITFPVSGNLTDDEAAFLVGKFIKFSTSL